jgi:hypothetical protein
MLQECRRHWLGGCLNVGVPKERLHGRHLRITDAEAGADRELKERPLPAHNVAASFARVLHPKQTKFSGDAD